MHVFTHKTAIPPPPKSTPDPPKATGPLESSSSIGTKGKKRRVFKKRDPTQSKKKRARRTRDKIHASTSDLLSMISDDSDIDDSSFGDQLSVSERSRHSGRFQKYVVVFVLCTVYTSYI